MATFIATLKFTEHGIENIRESPKRAAAFKSAAKKMGVKVKDEYWTLAVSMASLSLTLRTTKQQRQPCCIYHRKTT